MSSLGYGFYATHPGEVLNPSVSSPKVSAWLIRF